MYRKDLEELKETLTDKQKAKAFDRIIDIYDGCATTPELGSRFAEYMYRFIEHKWYEEKE